MLLTANIWVTLALRRVTHPLIIIIHTRVFHFTRIYFVSRGLSDRGVFRQNSVLSRFIAIWQRLLFISRCLHLSLSVVCFLHVFQPCVSNSVLQNHRNCVLLSVISTWSCLTRLVQCAYIIYYLLISCHWLIAVHSGTILPCLISVVK